MEASGDGLSISSSVFRQGNNTGEITGEYCISLNKGDLKMSLLEKKMCWRRS